jgi:hypothetical protein
MTEINKRIVPINDATHEQVQKLLPWFVVDTLRGEELALVNQHLHVCPECQADFAWQCKLQATAPASDVKPDVDRAFAKLRTRIDTARLQTKRSSIFDKFKEFSFGNRHWMQWALVAQFSVIIALAFLIATPYGNFATYRALGANTHSSGNMVIVFKPDTSEQALRRILNNAGARIVDGPTVTDAYLLSVSDERLATTLQKLRSDQAVVLAESLKGK